jgi:hypothetical protein
MRKPSVGGSTERRVCCGGRNRALAISTGTGRRCQAGLWQLSSPESREGGVMFWYGGP